MANTRRCQPQSDPTQREQSASLVAAPEQAEMFGAVLRRYRRAAGLTQEALAERAYLSARAIAALERGVNRTPRRDTLQLLTEALGLAGPARTQFEAAARRREMALSLAPLGDALQPAGVQRAHASAHPPLVGRQSELTLLERHLAGLGPPVLFLAGEPGIGKTRLLREAVQRAPRDGWTVLSGGCQRRGGQEPFAPLLEALERHLHHQPSVDLRGQLHGCAWLVRLLPEVADVPIEPLPAWTVLPEQERRLMFSAVARFLANVAGPAGTLLILDDLQWAGADALDLLATALRAPEARLRVVGAYRDTEVLPQDPLAVLVADLARAGMITQRTLAPLTPHEVAHLLYHLLTGMADQQKETQEAVRKRVLQRADGVPFFVVSCAQELHEGTLAGRAGEAVPWDLAQSVRQRVAALPAAAREVLGAAAVIGRRVPAALLLTVAGRPEREVLTALDAACRARLLVEKDAAYHFAHDVIREVIEADAGAARRVVLHRRVVQALEAADDPTSGRVVEQLAYHSQQAGDTHKALYYARLAGDWAVRMSAYRDAVVHYEVALELLPPDDLRARAELLDKLGAAADPLGEVSLQLRSWLEARRLYEQSGDRLKVGDLEGRLGRAYRRRGDFQAAFAHLQAALTVLDAVPPGRELARTYSALSWLTMLTVQCQESLDWGQKALALAAELSDIDITVSALISMGGALTSLGDVERGIASLEHSVALARGAGLSAETVLAYNNLGYFLLVAGEYRRAGEALRAGLAMADTAGWHSLKEYLLSNLGGVEMELGHWEDAADLLAQALRQSEAAGSVQRVWSVLRRGELLRRQGRLDEAGPLLAGILSEYESTDDNEILATCLPSVALVRLARGDHAGAVAAMERCIARWRSKGVALRYDQAVWQGLEVYLQAGQDARARALVEDLGARAARVAAPATRAYLADGRGLLAAHEDRHDEAAEHFRQAAEHWQQMGCPFQEARTRWRRAESLIHSGDTAAHAEGARERAVARATFERLGARMEVAAVDARYPPTLSGTSGSASCNRLRPGP